MNNDKVDRMTTFQSKMFEKNKIAAKTDIKTKEISAEERTANRYDLLNFMGIVNS